MKPRFRMLARLPGWAAFGLSLVGHTAFGTFLTNRFLIGAPERWPKAVLVLGHLALWPLVGLLNARLAWRQGILRALFLPYSPARVWALFFTLLGGRWLAQEVYRKRRPATLPVRVLRSHKRRTNLRAEVARQEGLTRTGPGALLRRINQIHDLEIITHEVRLPNLPPQFDGLSVVQISDIHYAHFASRAYISLCVQECLSLQPDLIVLTGDYQTYSGDVESAASLLAPLGRWSREERGGQGVFAVVGNHDREAGEQHVIDALSRAGIRVLRNAHATIRRGEASIFITGVADPWSGRANLGLAMLGIPQGACNILLAHVPDYFDEASGKVDIQLSGHNHGGQIKLPWLGAMLVTSRYGRRYAEGFFERGGTLMYVNRGVGGKPPIRLGCRPEITRFVLRTTDAHGQEPER